jgi:hypothetical protein
LRLILFTAFFCLNLSGEMLERSKQKEIQMSDETKDGGKEETSATPAEPQVDDLGNPVEPEEGGDKTATPAAEGEKKEAPAAEKLYTAEDMKKARESYQHETRKERDARIRAEAKAELLEQLAVKKPETPQAQATEAMPQRPNRDSFDTQEEFDEAWDGYIKETIKVAVSQTEKKIASQYDERQKETAAQAAQRQANEAVNAQIKRGSEKHADFDEVVTGKFSPALAEAFPLIPNGEDIAYHLATNPEEKERIESIKNPFVLAGELGALSYQLKTAAPGTSAQKPTTKAPSPPATLQGSSSTAVKQLKDATSSAERFAIMEREAREKRGRKA